MLAAEAHVNGQLNLVVVRTLTVEGQVGDHFRGAEFNAAQGREFFLTPGGLDGRDVSVAARAAVLGVEVEAVVLQSCHAGGRLMRGLQHNARRDLHEAAHGPEDKHDQHREGEAPVGLAVCHHRDHRLALPAGGVKPFSIPRVQAAWMPTD